MRLLSSLKTFAAAAATLALLALSLAGPAKAMAIYSYTGNNYTSFTTTTLLPPYDTTMSISGSLTVAAPLISLPRTDVSALVQSYSFFDGNQTLTDANSTVSRFEVITDSSGALLNWGLQLTQGSLSQIGDTSSQIFVGGGTIFNSSEFGFTRICTNVFFGFCTTETSSGRSTVAGTWSLSTPVAVPEPSTFILFAAGLLGLAGFGRRRRQAVGN